MIVKKFRKFSWEWLFIPVIPVLRRLRQED
jgi:hypothetical protein